MAASTSAFLRSNLSEQGLKRVLTKHRVSTMILQNKTPEEAARHLQRRASGRPGPIRYATKKVSAPLGRTSGRTKAKTALKASKASGAVRPVKGKAATKRVVNFKTRVWNELHVLICTNNKRYAKLRKLFGKESRMAQTAMVSTISASIGAYIGAASAVIVPFVALGLLAFLSVSKNAWCAGQA